MSTPTTSSSKTPAAASATTATDIASTAMSTSAATESRLSVAGYHSRWHEKHAIRNKTGKIIAVETGVGIYSPGGEGVPLDYGSEVEEGELEGDKVSLSPGHTDPNVGLRRPREDDSNASGSKRSRSGSGTPLAAAGALTTPRNGDDSAPSAVVAASRTGSVREPWMPSQFEISSRFGATVPPNLYALYSCNSIVDVAKRLHFDPMTDQRRDYYIGLFHELQWFASKKTSRRSKVPEWQALCQSWSPFVENFNKNSAGYRDQISQARERYEKFSKRVTYDTALRITERDINGYTSITYSSAVGDYSARPSFTPFGGGGGLPSQFAALRQELSLLKAQLVEVAQTTSNVKVEVGTSSLAPLKRVSALESALASHQT
uniref:Uncharacterized protein n=1 Tax=Phytophthora ramorum TaxID=164328 RepID=H3GK45_PHYRM